MGPEEKLFLGWLDYTEVNAGQSGTFNARPVAEHRTTDADQAVKVNLPDLDAPRRRTRRRPQGTHAWWTGRGDDLDNTLTRDVPGAGVGHRDGQGLVRHRGRLRLPLRRVLPRRRRRTGRTIGAPIDGSSATALDEPALQLQGRRRSRRCSASATRPTAASTRPARSSTTSRSRPSTGTVHRRRRDRRQRLDGRRAGRSRPAPRRATPPRYYLHREPPVRRLRRDPRPRAPTSSPTASPRPNRVEFFPFQDGMLVWLVDHAYADNNVAEHPGAGYALPVDAVAATR